MKSLEYSERLILLLSFIIIFTSFIIVTSNQLLKSTSYTGTVRDALGMGLEDLVEIKAEGYTTYTNKDGYFMLEIKHPLPLSLFNDQKIYQINMLPTFEYEGPAKDVACSQTGRSFLNIKLKCSSVIYPTAPTVALRVLATEIGKGPQDVKEISARKESLWNLLADESKTLWKSKEEFVSSLLLYEIKERKIKVQPISFVVSSPEKTLSKFNYLGKINLNGNLSSVDVSVFNASRKLLRKTVYFIKKENIWKYLMSETPETISRFNQKH